MGKRRAREIWEYDSMAEFEADGGVAGYGAGKVFIGTSLYYSDGERISIIGGGSEVAGVSLKRRVVLFGDSLTMGAVGAITPTSLTVSNGVLTGLVSSSNNFSVGNPITLQLTNNPDLNNKKLIVSAVSAGQFSVNVPYIPDGPIVAQAGKTIAITHNHLVGDTSLYPWLNMLGRYGFEISHIPATNGQTSADMVDIDLPVVLADLAFDFAFIMAGTNDYGISSDNPEYTINNVILVADAIKSVGKTPVVFTPPPIQNTQSGWTAARAACIQKITNRLVDICRIKNYLIFDINAALINASSTTGNWKTGYNTDDVHWNPTGSYNAAKILKPEFDKIFTPIDLSPKSLVDDYAINIGSDNLIRNPCMTGSVAAGSGATGNVPTLWTGLGIGSPTTCNYTVVPRSDFGNDINCQHVCGAAGSAAYPYIESADFKPALVAGKTYRAGIELLISAQTALKNIEALLTDSTGRIIGRAIQSVGTSSVLPNLVGETLYLTTEPFYYSSSGDYGSSIKFRVTLRFVDATGQATFKLGKCFLRPWSTIE